MHRHLVERNPFELHVATNADLYEGPLSHTKLRLPYPIHRLRKSRFGPKFAASITDFANLVWPAMRPRLLDAPVERFKPDVILTVADNSLSQLAQTAARRHNLPIACLFLDWFPVMKGHYGHKWTRRLLDRRFRELYRTCDLAFCTSEGMKDVLGTHPNSHVLYPMPGKHYAPRSNRSSGTKFQMAYVGSVENFYGRMLCRLLVALDLADDLELTIVGPNADWPEEVRQRYVARGKYLGFKPPAEAAEVLAQADVLLVVMSFEKEHELFMRTSFTTKFLDYVSFGKPVILWGPEYCTPVRIAREHGGAVVVDVDQTDAVVSVCRRLAANAGEREKCAREALELHTNIFNPDWLQNVFVTEIESLARRWQRDFAEAPSKGMPRKAAAR